MKNANTLPHMVYMENVHIKTLEIVNTPTTHQSKTSSLGSPPKQELTNSQLVLACYYVLLSWGIHPRGNIDMAPIARFMHLITGRPYKHVHSSEFYKKLKRTPNLKTGKGLIKDLEMLKDLFLRLELKEAALLVEHEINPVRQGTAK
jgi:hypothetical protein